MTITMHKTRTAEISLENEGYIQIKLVSDIIIDDADALDNLLVVKNISGNEKRLKLIDIRGNVVLTPKAKEVTKKQVSNKNTIARAYLVDSYLTGLLKTFFESFSKPDVPQKFFTKKDEAVKWLLSQLS
jgi:hypothetical protein